MIGIFEDDGGDTYDMISEVWDAVVSGGEHGTLSLIVSSGCDVSLGLIVNISDAAHNTRATGNSSFGAPRFGQVIIATQGMCYQKFDDIVVNDSQYLGDTRVAGQLPSGNGAVQQFTNSAGGDAHVLVNERVI